MKLCIVCDSNEVFSKYRDCGSVFYCKTCGIEWNNPDYPYKVKENIMKAKVELDEKAVEAIIAAYFLQKGNAVANVTLTAKKEYQDRPCSSSTAVFDKAIIEVEL